jgi:hypothetical protein
VADNWDKWAEKIQQQIDAATQAWNAAHANEDPIRIAWGYKNAEEEQREKAQPPYNRYLEGLANQNEWNFEICVLQGEQDTPDRAFISVDFSPPALLPRSAAELYNVLHHITQGVRLRLVPRESREEITITGLEFEVPFERITPRVWGFALHKLRVSYHQVHDYLFHDEGDDWWNDWFSDSEGDDQDDSDD